MPRVLWVFLLTVAVALGMRQAFGTDWFEFAGVVTGVMGVYLATAESPWTYPVGMVNVLIYAYVFWDAKLLADASLQIFFFVLLVHGLWSWLTRKPDSTPLRVSKLNARQIGIAAAAWAVGFAIYVPIINHFKGASPVLDSCLTVASMIGQVLLNRKFIENWPVWVVVNAVYIPLYFSRGLHSTGVLYVLFIGLAIKGWLHWRKTLTQQDSSLSPTP